jgi:general secretion pathway protein L
MATTPDFTSTRAARPWRRRLSAFWRWWSGELSRLAPERFTMFRGASHAPMVFLEGEDIMLVEPKIAGDGRATIAALDEPRRRAALRTLLERAGETRARTRVALAHDDVLVRRVTMPAATEENLRQVLAFEMDRLTPFKADEVYFDYRVISRDAAAGQVLVQLAAARREVVNARVEALRSLGASVQGVGLRDDSSGSRAPLDLLPSEQRGERESSRERMIQRGLLAAVILLLAAALLLPIVQKRLTVIALNPMLTKARQQAEATDGIARELERQVGDYNFLLARKHRTYPALAFIEEITRLLPDNTWVQQFELKTVGKGREVQISGETTSSSKLIEILEGSTLLQNAAPRGTEVRGSQPNTVRYMIAAEVRARPQPESRPLLDAVSVAPVPLPPAQQPLAPPASAAPAQQAQPPDAKAPTAAQPPAKAPGK